MRRVVVTGLGAVTPLGLGVKRSWTSILNGKIGVTSLATRFRMHSERLRALPCHVAALVPRGVNADGGWAPDEWLAAEHRHSMAEFTQYAIVAAEEAVRASGCLPKNDQDRELMGVSVGSGIGNFEDVYNTSIAYEKGGYRKVSPLFVPRLLINLASGHVAMKYGLQGPNIAATTACTTGAHAIGDAARLIAHGDANVMLAGAAEACIHPLAIGAFARARSLATDWNDTPEKASRPFDAQRAGFVIGEGAAMLVLEELSHAIDRKAPIYAELLGYGQSCDAYHLTAPLPSGHGAALAMSRALNDAARDPADVDYINAHGTSTKLGDLAENKAVQDVLLGRGRFANGTAAGGATRRFKASADEINISSTKGAVGHLLGAAGALEAVFTVLALRDGVLPPTMNLESFGEEVDEEGRSVWGCNYVAREAQERREGVKLALTNSFGFGGTNASLCFGRWDG